MPKGHGAVEREVLELLKLWHQDRFRQGLGLNAYPAGLTLLQIVTRIRPTGETRWRNVAYRHLSDSTRRALKALERKGLVRFSDKHWALKNWKPSAAERRNRAETQAEQARRNDKQQEGFEEIRRSFLARHTPGTAKLAKILAMLGSPEQDERDAAARMAEEERKRLGKSWSELLKD